MAKQRKQYSCCPPSGAIIGMWSCTSTSLFWHVCTHVEADGAGPQRGVLTAYNSARLNMVGGDECVMQQILQLIQLHRVLDTKQTITSRVSIIVFIHTDQWTFKHLGDHMIMVHCNGRRLMKSWSSLSNVVASTSLLVRSVRGRRACNGTNLN